MANESDLDPSAPPRRRGPQFNEPGPGRPKGKPNRLTLSMRAVIEHVLDEDPEQLRADLQALREQSLFRYWMVRVKLMEFVAPRMGAVAVVGAQTPNIKALSDEQLSALVASAESAIRETADESEPAVH